MFKNHAAVDLRSEDILCKRTAVHDMKAILTCLLVKKKKEYSKISLTQPLSGRKISQ